MADELLHRVSHYKITAFVGTCASSKMTVWLESEKEKKSDQPRQNKELVPKRGAATVTWMCLTENHKVILQMNI